ncbi:MAG: MATE family efflux transporter, partial [Actinobacteria bacterium]|nr:MATE family efflux transporter [Actinomycetota bacterium]
MGDRSQLHTRLLALPARPDVGTLRLYPRILGATRARVLAWRIVDFSKDREILGIALPALGALAADPLLSMVDTAMVGHLGAAPLAALGVATVAFSLVFVVFNFLAYGTTGPFARLTAAGRTDDAVRHVVQALWVALSLGLVSTVAGLVLSRPVGYLLGARGEVLDLFLAYFRIRILALTPMLIVLVGHGLFRGLLDTRTPLAITASANVVNALLGFLLIYPVGLGVRGAAIGAVVAQSGACAVFAWQMRRHLHPLMPPGAWRPHREAMRTLLLLSRDLLIRTFSLNAV